MSGNPSGARRPTVPDPSSALAALGPTLLPRGVILLVGAATAVVTVAGMRAFAGIIGPVALALMLTVAVHPLPDRLRRRGWPGWAAALAGLVVAYLIVLGIAVGLAISTARLATLLPTYQDEFATLVRQIESGLSHVGIQREEVNSALSSISLGRVAEAVGGIVSSFVGLLTGLFFLVTVMLFMGMDAGSFSQRLSEVSSERLAVAQALRGFAQGTRSYLVVSSVFGLIVAVIDTLALWALGVPLPILWGLLSFITNYIPNIGFVIGLIPPALLALLEGGPSLMLWVIVTYSVINVIIQSVIQPKVIGDSVGLSTSVTFLSLVFWAWVIGPLGALLAVPLSLLVKGLLVDIDPQTRWIGPLLSGVPAEDEPPPPPPEDVDGPGEPSLAVPVAADADGSARPSDPDRS